MEGERTMKKTMIAVLLMVSAAFAPRSLNVAEFPDQTFEFARPNKVFWQLWNELLCRELVQWTQTVLDDGRQTEAFSESRKALVGLSFGIVLKYAFDGSDCSAPGGELLMSRSSSIGGAAPASKA
jgi:hypothetical protein